MANNTPITARVNKGLFGKKSLSTTEPLLNVGAAGVSGNNQTRDIPSPAKISAGSIISNNWGKGKFSAVGTNDSEVGSNGGGSRGGFGGGFVVKEEEEKEYNRAPSQTAEESYSSMDKSKEANRQVKKSERKIGRLENKEPKSSKGKGRVARKLKEAKANLDMATQLSKNALESVKPTEKIPEKLPEKNLNPSPVVLKANDGFFAKKTPMKLKYFK